MTSAGSLARIIFPITAGVVATYFGSNIVFATLAAVLGGLPQPMPECVMGTALFDRLACINHSCAPNCSVTSGVHSMSVLVDAPIRAGEALTIAQGALGIHAEPLPVATDYSGVLVNGNLAVLNLADWVLDGGDYVVNLPFDWQIRELEIKLLTGELQPDKGSGDVWPSPTNHQDGPMATCTQIARHAKVRSSDDGSWGVGRKCSAPRGFAASGLRGSE